MPCHAGWTLSRVRPVHFKLADLIAQHKTAKECSQLTGLSLCQVYRLRATPVLQKLVASARQARLEADALAQQGNDALLSREEFRLLADLGQIRDFSPNTEKRLQACRTSLRLITHLRERHKKQEAEEVHILIEQPQDSEDAP